MFDILVFKFGFDLPFFLVAAVGLTKIIPLLLFRYHTYIYWIKAVWSKNQLIKYNFGLRENLHRSGKLVRHNPVKCFVKWGTSEISFLKFLNQSIIYWKRELHVRGNLNSAEIPINVNFQFKLEPKFCDIIFFSSSEMFLLLPLFFILTI